MDRVNFDAGNEWGADVSNTAPATSDTVEVPETPAVDTSEAGMEIEDVAQPAEMTKEEVAQAVAEFSVKGSKGEKKFKLDQNDPELVRTLQMGLDYRRMQAERDRAKAEAEKYNKDFKATAEKAKVWDELNEMARLGHREKIAAAVLGEEGFAKLKEEILLEQAAQESGDPEVRHEFEKSKAAREKQWNETQYQKKMREMEEKLSAIEEKGQLDSYRTLGTAALQKYDFRGFVEDKDVAAALNTKLWKLAWSDIEEASESGDITPEVINRAFAQNAKILRAGQGKAANERVNKLVEQRKADTKQKLQVAATQPSGSGKVDLTGWNGRAKDLLRRLAQQG